jgi:hypothetical protein
MTKWMEVLVQVMRFYDWRHSIHRIKGLKPNEKYHSSWALFFSKWITAYAQEGIDIW